MVNTLTTCTSLPNQYVTRAGRYQKKDISFKLNDITKYHNIAIMQFVGTKSANVRLKVSHKLKLSSSVWLLIQINTLIQVGWHLSIQYYRVNLTVYIRYGFLATSKSLKMYTID